VTASALHHNTQASCRCCSNKMNQRATCLHPTLMWHACYSSSTAASSSPASASMLPRRSRKVLGPAP
jgi:hypothetical protein